METFGMGKRSKNKYKSGGTKACETDVVKEYFINPIIKNE